MATRPFAAGRDEHRGPELLAAVADRGAVVVPLLDEDEVERLRRGYQSLATETGFGCRPSTISTDAGYRLGARDLVASILEPRVRELLPDYRCVVAAFVPKEPGPDSGMPLHQDWSTCDEQRWLPVEVWVPLTPASAEDGGLQVLVGSQRDAPRHRGSGSPLVYESQVDGAPQVAPVAPGEALVFHPAVHHGSGPNLGSALRLAVVSTFQPEAAEVLHYRVQPDGAVDAYRVPDDFYVSNHPPDAPVPGPWVASVRN